MPKKHITINELGNIEVNYKNGVSALECLYLSSEKCTNFQLKSIPLF